MLPREIFLRKMADLVSCLPLREGSDQESDHRNAAYARHLSGLNTDDFVEACDRIIMGDDWFPTIARIRAVASECAAERARSEQAVTIQPELVCPYCHGARWVRTGGYDPANMKAGEAGSRAQPCPKCTSAGGHDPYQETWIIQQEGGVPNENAPKDVDLSRRTWSVPRTLDGRVDMKAMYRESRRLRGLDPNVDARPSGVGSWKSIGDVIAPPVEPESARELVAAGDWSVDDVPF